MLSELESVNLSSSGKANSAKRPKTRSTCVQAKSLTGTEEF